MTKLTKILVGSLVILILGYLFFSLAQLIIQPDSPEQQKIKSDLEIADSQNLDSDNDGLLDWEEVLWGTDPKNPDTNGNGILDGIESDLKSNNLQNVLTLEQLISVDKNLLQLVPKKNETLTENDATLLNPNNKNLLREYGNQLGSILNGHFQTNSNESFVFKELIASSTPESFDQIKLIGQNYKNLSEKIKSLTPPAELTVLTTGLSANYLTQSISILEIASFKNRGSVPVEIFLKHNENVIATGKNLLGLLNFFKENRIVFQPGESGVIFNLPF